MHTDGGAWTNEAVRNRTKKEAMNSAQNAALYPTSGLVIKTSDFMPYTIVPAYVANVQPATWATIYIGTFSIVMR